MQKRLVITLALLVLAGCQYMGQEEAAPQIGLGTEGIHIEFLADTPPPVVYSPGETLIMLIAENRGRYNKGTGEFGNVYLSGFDTSIIRPEVSFTLPSVMGVGGGKIAVPDVVKPIPALTARDQYTTRGQTDIIDFGKVTIANLAEYHVDTYNTVILATACYEYETSASTEICIDFNPFQTTQVQKTCTPQNKALGSQGAPIAVTQIEVEPSKDITHLRIHVQNAGGGTVFKKDAIDKCNPYSGGLQYTDIDFVKIEDVTMLGKSIKEAGCKPSEELRLSGGEGIIYCTVRKEETAPTTEFTTPLNIQLSYSYRQTTLKPIQIKKA